MRIATLHAAVAPPLERDAQIAALADIETEPLLVSADLSAPPATVRPLLGTAPAGVIEARHLDYLLVRGLRVRRSARIALGTSSAGVSDHFIVWPELAPAEPPHYASGSAFRLRVSPRCDASRSSDHVHARVRQRGDADDARRRLEARARVETGRTPLSLLRPGLTPLPLPHQPTQTPSALDLRRGRRCGRGGLRRGGRWSGPLSCRAGCTRRICRCLWRGG